MVKLNFEPHTTINTIKSKLQSSPRTLLDITSEEVKFYKFNLQSLLSFIIKVPIFHRNYFILCNVGDTRRDTRTHRGKKHRNQVSAKLTSPVNSYYLEANRSRRHGV